MNIKNILGWAPSIEFADAEKFFTLHEPHRRVTRYEIFKENENDLEAAVSLSEGNAYDLSRTIRTSDRNMHVEQKLTSRNGGLLLDFVMQFKFPKEDYLYGEINGQHITHKGQNIYYQHPTDSVSLSGLERRITITSSSGGGFRHFMYIRDEPGYWVIHVRLLPPADSSTCLKLNTRWYNKALPFWIERCFRLISSRHLLYHGERRKQWSWFRKILYWLLPLSRYPLGHLDKGSTLSISADVFVAEVARAYTQTAQKPGSQNDCYSFPNSRPSQPDSKEAPTE